MDPKQEEIKKKFGITAASFEPTDKPAENEVIISTEPQNLSDQSKNFPENVNKKRDVTLISRLRVTDTLTISYEIEKRPGRPPVPRISIDSRVGRRLDGRSKWAHIRIYDENSVEDLKTGLDKMLDMVMLPAKYLQMEVNADNMMKLEQDGTMAEVHKYVSQIP